MDYEPIFRNTGVSDDDWLLQEALAVIGDLDDNCNEPCFDSHEGNASKANANAVLASTTSPVAFNGSSAPEILLYVDGDQKNALGSGRTLAQWPAKRPAPQPLVRTQTRRRCELAYLRGLVGDLEGQLNALRTTGEQQEIGRPENENESSEMTTTLWKSVASSQQAQRLQAERENAKLKILLRDQIQVGKKLERLLLRKRPSDEALQSSELSAKRLQCMSLQMWDRSQVYDELLASCAEIYADTERVMSRFDCTRQTALRRNIELVHHPECGIMLQTSEQRIFPFHYEETATELWEMFLTASPHLSILNHDSKYDPAQESVTTKLQFTMKTQIAHETGSFAVKAVKQRYVEANRVVIVYSSRVEPSEVSATKMDGIVMHDKAWYVIEPLRSNPSRGSLMTAYYLSVPVVDGQLPDQEHKVGTLTNFLLSCISVELELHHSLLENRLIEKSLQQD